MVETQRQNLWERTRHVMKTLFDSGAGTKGQAGGEPPDQTGLDMVDAYERVKGAVVQVRTPSGGGTGMVVADGRLILTNHHVVGSAPWVAIVSRDRSPRPARVLFGDRKLDLAILHIESPEPVRLRFAQHPARSATRVFAVGYPLGLSSNVTQGIISAVEPPSEMNGEVEWLRTDAAINPGNSGGPLLTVDGLVAGMNTFGRDDAHGINYALPARYLHAAIEKAKSRNFDIRLYCPHCGHSAPEGKYCEVCGARLQRYPIPEDLIEGPRAGEESKLDARVRRSLEQAREAIAASLVNLVADLQEDFQIGAQQEQIGNADWLLRTDREIIEGVRFQVEILRDHPHLLISKDIEGLPYEAVLTFYKALLDLNRPAVLGASKICLAEDRALLRQVRLADSLDPSKVSSAFFSFFASAIALDKQINGADSPDSGEESMQQETEAGDGSPEGERQDAGLLRRLYDKISKIFTPGGHDPWTENRLISDIEGVLQSIRNATASRESMVCSWMLTQDERQTRVALVCPSDEPWRVEMETPIMECPTTHELAFHRRLLEMNNLEVMGPARLFIQEEEAYIGAMKEIEGMDQRELIEVMEDLGREASRAAKELQEEFPSL